MSGPAATATASGLPASDVSSLVGAASSIVASANPGDAKAAISTLLSAYMAADPSLYASNSAALQSISEYLAAGGLAAANASPVGSAAGE